VTQQLRLRAIAPVLVLGAAIATAGAGCTGCPTALLSGELVEQEGDLVIATSDTGPAEHIEWPFGYSVHSVDGHVVLSDVLGGVKARAGDTVRLGGGEAESGSFKVCGLLEVDPA
jgi:hypothetical protein